MILSHFVKVSAGGFPGVCWKLCHEQSEAFQAEKQRIQEEANRKRADAAREQPRTETGVFQPVVRQSVGSPAHTPPATQAKAAASKTNPGAVARGLSGTGDLRKIEGIFFRSQSATAKLAVFALDRINSNLTLHG